MIASLLPRRTSGFLKRCFRLIDAVSFSESIREIAENLNRRTSRITPAVHSLRSHPGGFIRAFQKRRMGMAEAYAHIAGEYDIQDYRKRLYALNMLMSFSSHAKTVSMPLNTARVQIELMKEAVKSTHNRRRQMEMISDFTIASYGHEAAIRRFLRELKRIETPESGKRLKDLDLGWDSHVHDNLSAGRKTPSQVILDGFIKGMSRLTLVYYDIPHRDILYEAMEAGEILGIHVNIAIEFSIGEKKQRRHYLFVPPALTYDSFLEYFDHNCRMLARFVDALEENKHRRRSVITEILNEFNKTHRLMINRGYPEQSIFSLEALKVEDVEKLVIRGQYSRNNLSELLFTRLTNVLKNRTFALKVRYEISKQLFRKGMITTWEMERIEAAYARGRETFTRLTPTDIKTDYFSPKLLVDFDSAFPGETEILRELKEAGGEITYSRPLEHGVAAAVKTLLRCHDHIDKIQLINMSESIDRDPTEIIQLCDFVDLLNNGSLRDTKRFISDLEISGIDDEMLRKAYEKFHAVPLLPVAASASTGWKPQAPGMGFIESSRLPQKSKKQFTRTHYRLPLPVSALVLGKGRRPAGGGPSENAEIYCLGKSGQFRPNRVGDEEEFEWIGWRRVWRYLNPTLKNVIRVGIGFLPAYLWIGPEYTFIWLGITFFRNVFVDLVALSGFRPKTWSFGNVNFDNTSQSLFWTGFSVPVLGTVKQGFDALWPWTPAGVVFEWAKFFFICVANGTYISAHNKIRQFDNRVIRANFFRSILAWPFSAVFAPVGNALMIPAIVQAKFWSDVVAAVIEGTGKFHQKIVLRKRDLKELLPLLRHSEKSARLTAMLDILFIWAKRQRGSTCLGRILRDTEGPMTAFWQKYFRRKPESTEKERSGLEYLPLLIDLFSPQKCHEDLARLLLTRCDSHEILVLTRLINTHLVPFHDWLVRLGKKRAPYESLGSQNPDTSE